MAFIKTQKLVFNEDGTIKSGSAAIIDTTYVKDAKYHTKHSVRERLGKVLFISSDKKVGIFQSPNRGLVEYNANLDSFKEVSLDDERIAHKKLKESTQIHTVFGDAYFLFKFMKNEHLLEVLSKVFTKNEDMQRMIAHIIHGIAKDGSRITCDNFIEKSFISYLCKDLNFNTLKSDTSFFSKLGNDDIKVSFFKEFVKAMKKLDPEFGKACFIDSTPLPNDIENNPFNALSCHGINSTGVMMRLVLIADNKTGLPVWYEIIPGNVLNINTVMTVVEDVTTTLGIEIGDLVLDAGYISKNLLQAFNVDSEKTLIGRMPAKKGYPYKDLYWEFKEQFNRGKYQFIRNSHSYFGKQKQIEIFGVKEYAYLYIDRNNALQYFNKYLLNHGEEYAKLKDKDKDWKMVCGGYFVIISNLDLTPEEMLSRYFARVDIEGFFKTSKHYLDLLPIAKWKDDTVRGGILFDMINPIFACNFTQNSKWSFCSKNLSVCLDLFLQVFVPLLPSE